MFDFLNPHARWERLAHQHGLVLRSLPGDKWAALDWSGKVVTIQDSPSDAIQIAIGQESLFLTPEIAMGESNK